MSQNMNHCELAEKVLDESTYKEMWKKTETIDAPGRLDNLEELIRSMQGFDSLAGFLEHVALVMAADADSDGDKVSIMTMHAAKGLEFDLVFLPGWEEGLFPHQRSLDENGEAGLEEERRLAYVALTRARKSAVISFAHNRRVHNLWQSALPSRFIDELPKQHVQTEEINNSYDYQENILFAASAVSRNNPASLPVEKSAFESGMRIFHQKFGYGLVTGVDGDKLTISFDKAGSKRVMASFVKAAANG